MATKKLILVVGATGAQGKPVVSALLAPQDDGTPSPYSVRALTRDPTSAEAQSLAEVGAELFQGRFDDMESIAAAYEGCYGVFVNTDTFSAGEKGEIYAGIKMFEQAHRASPLKHFIWSALDYGSKLGNYDPKYHTVHLDAKGVVSDFLRSQPSAADGESLTWTVITSGPYLENIGGTLLGPLKERENGTVVWAIPTGDGHIPATSVEDIGWWARYTFDHRSETSGQDLKIATEFMTIDQLVETFTHVTGIPAIHKRISIEEYQKIYADYYKRPILRGQPDGPTVGDTFAGMWRVWGDDLLTRDMEWIRRVHPTGYTLESFIREKGFDGKPIPNFRLLKDLHLRRAG
ncbi:hypothetical protein GYMLUDRAFT_839191 [Collybiopsis luxurians FD-317 M1]|uniref:NmrA-like domain-containing protein n=1 Tax=Collybiopsis luxurians FD-317 M1 TaxID=944289 RepID=A0A0D0AY82_9AGAR|nr:hypothetical protein GYMLUDRAFT_839191 [Collybiopsis luxurians FD-317 M1]